MPDGVRLALLLNLGCYMSFAISTTTSPLRWKSREKLRGSAELFSDRAAVFRFPNKEFEKHLNTKIPIFGSNEHESYENDYENEEVRPNHNYLKDSALSEEEHAEESTVDPEL
ncbi:unnamed protein product [Bursaphelenchus okinawaensis]|uniref:Uncharacterized protein n=1 Tax=Bursaphelenchus okinawaensis TaxID=465554 RepID=A0A811L8N7_9BILA|nr:unnamed protein product [Bursaphelenchus okinawaensis]CAG9118088.1 unnamed protein product [Bursaphelenchus okinawaensis]